DHTYLAHIKPPPFKRRCAGGHGRDRVRYRRRAVRPLSGRRRHRGLSYGAEGLDAPRRLLWAACLRRPAPLQFERPTESTPADGLVRVSSCIAGEFVFGMKDASLRGM